MTPVRFQTLLNKYGTAETVAGAVNERGIRPGESQATEVVEVEDLQLRALLALHQQSEPEKAGKVFPSLPPEALYIQASLFQPKSE